MLRPELVYSVWRVGVGRVTCTVQGIMQPPSPILLTSLLYICLDETHTHTAIQHARFCFELQGSVLLRYINKTVIFISGSQSESKSFCIAFPYVINM